MAITVGDIERDVLEILQKSPGLVNSYYTEPKLRTAVQECFDYVTTLFFDAEYGGWVDDIKYLDTTAGHALVDLPKDIAQIKVVRYKINGVYVPLTYDKEERSVQTAPSEGTTGNAARYRLVGSQIYFNPPLFDGGTGYLQIEGTFYPERFSGKLDQIGPIWNPAFKNFIKYRCASILVSHKRDYTPPWGRFEAEWAAQVGKLISKRVNTTTTITEFQG